MIRAISMVTIIIASILASFIIQSSQAHDYNWGKCPSVKSFDDFDIDKFLGRWYVIMKTSTSSECVRYNFTKTWNGNVQIEQTMRILTGTPVRYIGDLEVIDRGVPSKMRANFPLNYGTASYNVVWTDYNQAIIFSCQDLPRSHRQSVSILSRDMFPTKSQTNKIYDELANAHLDSSDLSHVSHEKCPLVFDDPVVINRETLSTKNFASIVRKGGEKLGDFIEYTATKVRSLFGSETSAVQSKPDENQENKANIMTSSNVNKFNEIPKVIETNKRDEYEIFNQIENDAEWL